MSSNPSLSFNPLLGTLCCSLMPHIHLTILISAHWIAASFSYLRGQVSLPCNILLRTHNCCTISLSLSMIYPYWYVMVPTAWIYSIKFEFWSPQLHQHLCLHSSCHSNNKKAVLSQRWPCNAPYIWPLICGCSTACYIVIYLSTTCNDQKLKPHHTNFCPKDCLHSLMKRCHYVWQECVHQ